jgi:hypothetical protein
MGKNTLTEEIYRMRKLMGHDSNEYRENVTSFDRLLEEKMIKKYLLKEEDGEEPKFSDWSNGGKVNWENAKLKDIIEYISEVDEYFGGSFLNNPSYTTMMDWFADNDSESVRNSLKEWMFGDIYYGIKKSEDVKQTKKNVVAPDEYDKNLQAELTTNLGEASKIDLKTLNVTDKNLKKSIDTLISSRTLEKLNKELIAINNGKVFLKKEIIEPLNDKIFTLINYYKNPDSVESSIETIKDVADYLLGFKLSDKKEIGLDVDDEEVKIDVDVNQRIGIKNSIMKKLSTEIESVGEDTYRKLLKKISNITITDEPKELKQFKVGDETGKGVPIMTEGDSDIFQYPPENTPEGERNTLSNNFFPDDGTSMSSEAIEGIREQLRLLRKFIMTQDSEVEAQRTENGLGEEFKLDVSSINIFVYSSTSKVRTTYKSKDKSFSEGNNIKLAEDRSGVIENSIRGILKQYKLDEYNIILASKIEKPNIGPGWLKLDGKYADGSDVPVTAYGAMFQEAYKKDNTLTPQLFYGNRGTDWAKKSSQKLGREISQQELSQEYNDIYGPFRMNLAGISVTLRKPTIVTKEEVGEDYFVIAVPGMGLEFESDGEFSFRDTWDNFKRGVKKLKRKIKKSLRNLKPKRRFFGKAPDFSKVCLTCCPKWG